MNRTRLTPSFKAVVLAHQKRADGTFNIKILVSMRSQRRYIPTPWQVTGADVTAKMRLRTRRIIDQCEDLMRRYRERCNDAGAALATMTVDDVVRLVTAPEPEEWSLDIAAYTEEYIGRLVAQGREGSARSYRTALASLRGYAGRDRVDVSEITPRFLEGWMAWIERQPSYLRGEGRGQAQYVYMSKLRAMHNRAKREFNDEAAGVVLIAGSPFGRVELPRVSPPRKRALSLGQLRAVLAVPDEEGQGRRRDMARDLFELSFMLMGMNAADLYDCSDYSAGRITYNRVKTRTRRADGAEMSVLVPPEALALVEKYRDPTGERVFDFHRRYRTCAIFEVALGRGMRRLGEAAGVERLQFYAARHTWATLAVNEAGVDKYTVHAALNHVDPDMKVTDVYVQRDWRPLDAANRRVLDYVAGRED